MSDISRRLFLKISATSAVTAATGWSMLPGLAAEFPPSLLPPSLANISLWDDPATVLSRRGQPQAIRSTHGSGTPEWHYPGLTVWFFYRPHLEVKAVLLTSALGGSTPTGIQVGSSVSDLKRAYGPALVEFIGGGGFWIALSRTTRLDFLTENSAVAFVKLHDRTCWNCYPVTGPQGEKKGN
jgi:hypothetical protein